MILQLNPQIPVWIVANLDGFPAGPGLAIGWLDYSADHDFLWAVAYDEGGEVWWVPNPLVRLRANRSAGRTGGTT